MAAVNRNMFDASVTTEHPRERSLMVLPLNLIAFIISHLDDPGDLARLCRTCRVLNYMALPQLYRNLTLTSYDKIRYRDEQPEGMGSASPFSMGLNAVITRPYGSLVRSLTLRGDWREHDLEEHARVGRVPDSSMMLNIAVRAAVDKMPDLESFSWELNTKMLETVYLGLTQRPNLTTLTLRFPSSRHPRPTIVIPPMPHLRYLKITDIDPLCYPDDISTLLWKARKLRELKMHWSPRMRNAQEPSVMLHDYFRKCIAARQPLAVKKMGLQNLYALHTEEFALAFDQHSVEDVTILNDISSANAMNTFVDSTWPINPPNSRVKLKSVRQDAISKRHAEFLRGFTGLERLYFVNEAPNPNDVANSPRQLASISALTPPSLDSSNPPSNGADTPDATPADSPRLQNSVLDSYLNNITMNHAATLRHLLLPSKWPLSAQAIARLVHASPQLEQLAFATDMSNVDTLGLVLPFLRNLAALRLLVPTGTVAPKQSAKMYQPPAGPLLKSKSNAAFSHAQTLADVVNMDDEILMETLSEGFADQQVFSNMKIIGMGRKAFELGEYYTVPANDAAPRGAESEPETPVADRSAETNGAQAKPSPHGPNGAPPRDRGASPSVSGILTPGGAPAHEPVQPRSLLGKRARDDERSPSVREILPSECMPTARPYTADGRLWRRRVRRVGWEVLQHWEIWGLDTHEL